MTREQAEILLDYLYEYMKMRDFRMQTSWNDPCYEDRVRAEDDYRRWTVDALVEYTEPK